MNKKTINVNLTYLNFLVKLIIESRDKSHLCIIPLASFECNPKGLEDNLMGNPKWTEYYGSAKINAFPLSSLNPKEGDADNVIYHIIYCNCHFKFLKP